MTQAQKVTLTLLRLSLSAIFLYSSISKIMDGDWTSASLLNNATSFPGLFSWFAHPANIGWVDALNMYGQLALGIAFFLGVFLPLAAIGAMLMMALYYLAQLHFPYAGRGTTSLLIDQHVIYSISFFLLWKFDAGSYYGLKTILDSILPRVLKKLN